MQTRTRILLLGTIGVAVIGTAAIGAHQLEAGADADTGPLPTIVRKTQADVPLISEDADITVRMPDATATAVRPAGEPVPYAMLLAERDGWFADRIVAATRSASPDAPWLAEVVAWMPAVWRLLRDHPAAPEKQALVERGRALLASGCADPAVMALQGLIHPEFPVQQDLLRRSAPLLAKGSWSQALRALVHHRLARGQQPTDPRQLSRLAEALISARDAGDFADDRGAAVLLAIMRELSDDLKPYASRMANRLADGKGLPPWAVATLLGRFRIDLAWRFRGNGYASSVTEDGWRGFRQELAFARTALEAATKLAPGRSEPRVALLTVILGEGGDDAASRLREQFARVQQASPDHLAACALLISALRPRWYGDPETMLKQGMEWTGASAPGSYLPWAGLEALRDLDRDLGLSGAVYRQQGVAETFDRVANAYLSAEDPLVDRRTLDAIAFRAAFLGGRYDLALPHWRALDGRPTENLANDPRLVLRFAQGMCELGVLVPQPEVDALIADRLAEPEPGMVAHLLETPGLTPASRGWLEHLAATARNRQRFAKGEALALPGSAGLAGWLPLIGAWRSEGEALIVDSGYLGHLLPLASPVGDRFILSGRISILSTSNGSWQTGVVLGHPQAHVEDSRGWGSVRFRPIADGISAELSDGFSAHRELATSPVADPRSFRFRIAVGDRNCSVAIDGRTVLERASLPRAARMDASAVVGLGAYMSDNAVTVRYDELRLSRDEHRAESGGSGTPP